MASCSKQFIEPFSSAIFELKNQVHLIRNELFKVEKSASETRSLSVALRILLEADHRFEEAFEIFMKLSDSDVFFFIEKHLLYKLEWVSKRILDLMKIDSDKCSQILIEHQEDFPIRFVRYYLVSITCLQQNRLSDRLFILSLKSKQVT